MSLHRGTLTIGLVVFSLFASTSAGNAMWTAGATTNGRAESGTVAVAYTGTPALAVTYNLTTLADTAPITVTNVGSLTAPHTLQLSAPSASVLASSMIVRTWPVTAAAQCAATSVIPTTATSSFLTNVPALTTTLAAGAAILYCIRTSITPDQQRTFAAQNVTVTATVTSALGSWTATPASQTALQVLTDTTPPSVPTVLARTLSTQTTLTWSASTDNTGTTAYDVYRNGQLMASVAGTTATVAGLTAGTAYIFTVRARDAAGNASALSTALTVKTVDITINARYNLTSSVGGLCLSAMDNSNAQGIPLVERKCLGAPTQVWAFAVSNLDYFVVSADHAPLVWGLDASATYGQLFTANLATSQEWSVVSTSLDTYQFVNRANDKCLQLGSVTGNGVATTLATCATIPQQTFTMSLR